MRESRDESGITLRTKPTVATASYRNCLVIEGERDCWERRR